MGLWVVAMEVSLAFAWYGKRGADSLAAQEAMEHNANRRLTAADARFVTLDLDALVVDGEVVAWLIVDDVLRQRGGDALA